MIISADENALYIAASPYQGGANYLGLVSKFDISDKTQIVQESPRYSRQTSIGRFYLSKDETNTFIDIKDALIITDNTDAGINEVSRIESKNIRGVVTTQDGDRLYINIAGKIHIYDFSNKQTPVLLDTIYLGVSSNIMLSKDEQTIYTYTGSSITIVDISGI